jgi:hypothetical protein
MIRADWCDGSASELALQPDSSGHKISVNSMFRYCPANWPRPAPVSAFLRLDV